MVGSLTAALALGGVTAAGAADPDPDEFTPAGYAFCGWLDLETKQWKTVWNDRLAGVTVVLFTRNMSCSSARKNYSRTTSTWDGRKLGYKRAGYRCATLKNQYEFSDYRCTKVGRSKVAYRVRSAA